MSMLRASKVGELIGANSELQLWKDARILYKQGDLWITAEMTSESIDSCFQAMGDSFEPGASANMIQYPPFCPH